mmetsp:Transcript_11662/g.16655  ORF Transcript_11662/g.16655 Transcript_11662/m.16655 type:complete len:543 (+) Transcript_11662:312-1940(+)
MKTITFWMNTNTNTKTHNNLDDDEMLLSHLANSERWLMTENYVEPAYWQRYRDQYDRRIKRCKFLENVPPQTNSDCQFMETGDYTCLFGETTCPSSSSPDALHPTQSCDCDAPDRLWRCDTFDPCMTSVTDTCPELHPATFSTSITCSVQGQECNYGSQTCCGGQTFELVKCTCNNGIFQCVNNYSCRFETCPGTADLISTPPPIVTSSTSPPPTVQSSSNPSGTIFIPPSSIPSAGPSIITPKPSGSASPSNSKPVPSDMPSYAPSSGPSIATSSPSGSGSTAPSIATAVPSFSPSSGPSIATPQPSGTGSSPPSVATAVPSFSPSSGPSITTPNPSSTTSVAPSAATAEPSSNPSYVPTVAATSLPSSNPSSGPSVSTGAPSGSPTKKAVDPCLDYQETVELGSDLTLQYVITKGKFRAKLTLDKDAGWIGFGRSPDGLMVGSEVVIGSGDGLVDKRSLGGKDASMIDLMPLQSLTGASFQLVGGQMVLEYEKLLVEDGELPITTEESQFVWGQGFSNDFGFHFKRGSVAIALKSCDVAR